MNGCLTYPKNSRNLDIKRNFLFHFFVLFVFIGDKSSVFVNLSLLPIMAGLSLCTASELSFNMVGFISALLNNVMDW